MPTLQELEKPAAGQRLGPNLGNGESGGDDLEFKESGVKVKNCSLETGDLGVKVGGGEILTPKIEPPYARARNIGSSPKILNISSELVELGLREKAINAYSEALKAEKQGWEGARDPDHYARLKAAEQIINRTDGKVVDRSEILMLNASLTPDQLSQMRLPEAQQTALSVSLGDKLGSELGG